MVIEIPCKCRHLLSSEELNKISKEELVKILFEQLIEMICKKCGEVFQVLDKTRFFSSDNDDMWKSYA